MEYLALFVVTCIGAIVYASRKVFLAKISVVDTVGMRYRDDTGELEHGNLAESIQTRWEKPFQSLPVNVDIPRLVRKISVLSNGNRVFSVNEDTIPDPTLSPGNPRQETVIIRDFLLTLSSALGDSIERRETMNYRFVEFFGRSGDASVFLLDFLDKVVGGESSVVKVLKACNQSILAPGILKLKFGVGNHYPFKDVRGSWHIVVDVFPDSVCVTHTKYEKSMDDLPNMYFEFNWSMKIAFDRDLTHVTGSSLFIDGVQFGDGVPPKTREKIQHVMKKFIRQK